MKMHNVIFLSLSLSVASCGGSGGGSANSDNTDTGGSSSGGSSSSDGGNATGNTVRSVGIVTVDEYVEDNEVDAGAAFFSYSVGVDVGEISDVFSPQLDVCTVEVVDVNSFDSGDFEAPGIDSTADVAFASAGDVLTLMSGTGSYLELVKESAFGLTFYTAQPEYVDGPMPAQLTLNIPGDEFPPFANVSMPVVQSLTGVTPDDFTPIFPSTNFTWNAGSNTDAFINISVQSPNIDGTFTSVDCVVRDDGAFSFPTQTQSELGASFVTYGAEVSRNAMALQQQGDAMLLLMGSSSK